MRGFGLFVAVGLVGSLLTGSAFAQTAASAFNSTRDAYEAWQKAGDDNGRRPAFEWLETYARTCPSAVLIDALTYLGRSAPANGSSSNSFIAVCAWRGAPEALVADRQAVALQLADWQSVAGNYEAAVAALTTHLKSADLPTALRAVTVRKAAQILTDNLGKPADAAALLATVIATVPPEKDPYNFVDLVNARAVILQLGLKDLPGAEAETRRVLALGDVCPGPAYAQAADRLVLLLSATGRTNEVPDALLLVFRHLSLPAAGCARKLIDAGVPFAQLEEALGALRAHVPPPFTTPTELQTRLERIQPEAVELLLALGRPDEAVRECRAYALSASDRSYPQAVELAARCLKTLDGDLGRANALLEFHTSAPPPDGCGNPLLTFPVLTDPVRAEAARQTEQPPTDWSGWLNRAALLAWLDRPADSMDAARAAFACCPMASNTLQTCANAVARPVLVATREPDLGQRMTDFLLVGAVGPDGRVGTPDDIADPFPEARKRLAYVASPSSSTAANPK